MSIGWRFALTAALALGTAGCATLPPPVEGDASTVSLADWHAVSLPGLLFASDLAPDALRSAARAAERFLALAAELLPEGRLDPERPVRLFLFRREEALAAFVPPRARGLATHSERGLSLSASAGPARAGDVSAASPVVFHELTHALLEHAQPETLPRWYHDGVAELLSTAGFQDGRAEVGRVPPDRVAALTAAPMPLAALLDGVREDFRGEDVDRYYARAWALVQWLWLGGGPAQQLPRYFDALASGVAPLEAWTQAMGASPSETEAQLDAFVARADFATRSVSLPPPRTLPPIRSLPPERIGFWLGQYALDQQRPVLAGALLERARRAAPADDTLRAVRAEAFAMEGRLGEAARLLATPAPARGPEAARVRGELALRRYAALPREARAEQGRALLTAAQRSLEDALAQDVDCARCWLSLASAYASDAGAPVAQARAALRESEARLGTVPTTRLVRGLLALRDADFAAARNAVAPLIGHESGSVRRQAEALLEKVRRAEAARDFQSR